MAKTHKSLGVRQRGGIQGAQSAPDNATVYIAACAWSLAALQLQQQQQQLLHRCCCGVSEVAATPTPASSLWQRNCVKNYSGILITLVNILPESEKKEFLDSDSDSYETRDATNEVNALQLQQQTQNVASSQIPPFFFSLNRGMWVCVYIGKPKHANSTNEPSFHSWNCPDWQGKKKQAESGECEGNSSWLHVRAQFIFNSIKDQMH